MASKGYKKEVRPGVWKCMIWLPAEPGEKAKQKGWTTYGTERDADEAIEEVRVDARRGNLQRPNRDLTVGEYLKNWAVTRRPVMRSGHAADRYEDMVRLHIEPSPLGKRPLTSATKQDVERFLTGLEQPGANKRSKTRGLAPQSRRHILRLLKQGFSDAVMDGRLKVSPAKTVPLPAPDNEEGRALEDHEAQRLLECAKGRPIYAVLYLALATGARRGELLVLRWSDAKGNRLTIQRALDNARSGKREKETKSGVKRSLVLSPQAVKFLEQHKAAQEAHRRALPPGVWANKDLILCNELGDWLKPSTVTGQVCRIAHVAELEDISLHSLRHTFASQALARGIRMHVVSRLLGHTDLQTTVKRYGHLLVDELNEAAVQMGEFLQTATAPTEDVNGHPNC